MTTACCHPQIDRRSQGAARTAQAPDWAQAMRRAERLESSVARLPCFHRHALGTELRHSTQLLQVGVMRCARTTSGLDLARELGELVSVVQQLQVQFVLASTISTFVSSSTFALAADMVDRIGLQSASWLQQVRHAVRSDSGGH